MDFFGFEHCWKHLRFKTLYNKGQVDFRCFNVELLRIVLLNQVSSYSCLA